jgi:hypothetical protein
MTNDHDAHTELLKWEATNAVKMHEGYDASDLKSVKLHTEIDRMFDEEFIPALRCDGVHAAIDVAEKMFGMLHPNGTLGERRNWVLGFVLPSVHREISYREPTLPHDEDDEHGAVHGKGSFANPNSRAIPRKRSK